MALPLPCCVTLVMLSCVLDLKSLFPGEGRACLALCCSPLPPACPMGAGSVPRGHLWNVSVRTSLGCTGTLWVPILCLKGFSLRLTVINPLSMFSTKINT